MDADDEDARSLGSKKATCPTGVNVQDWMRVQSHGGHGDAAGNLAAPPGRAATTMASPRSTAGPRSLDRVRRDSLAHPNSMAGGESDASSDEHDGSPPEPQYPPPKAGSARRASLYERANNMGLPPSSNSNVSSGLLDTGYGLEPPLAIGLNPHTIGLNPRALGAGQSSISILSGPALDPVEPHSGSAHHHRLVSSSQGSRVENTDRELIVAGERVEDACVGLPTPLGQARRASLFERANNSNDDAPQIPQRQNIEPEGSGGQFATRVCEGNDNAGLVCVQEANVGSAGLEGGEQQDGLLSPGQTNLVLRDWLMHVLEKDNQLDADVSSTDNWSRGVRRILRTHPYTFFIALVIFVLISI